QDYSHELVCMTGMERMVVPIRAIGAQAILDFPDQLDFSKCLVKCSIQKTLLVHNTGNLEAHYQISTQSPFSVVPASGTVGAGDTMEVTVGFHPLTTGDHFGSLVVCCNTGEESICTNLHGEAVDVNVGLSTNSVEFKTFVNMSNYTTVFIENRSNITAHFQWKAFPTEEDDNEEKSRRCRLLQPPNEVWLKNLMEEKEIEKVEGFCEDRTALLRNMVQEEMAKVQEDPLLFSDDIFHIEPMELVAPSSELGTSTETAWKIQCNRGNCCTEMDISGHESRLHLRGEGQGPLLELCCDTLIVGNIYIYTAHIFEV
ncbi:HYDIN protein, partial [Irena cyanogastra]|nr:HYDIN protein [Irena cyanogastra]